MTQRQTTHPGSVAIQSQRDTHIHQGMSFDDVAKIIDMLAAQIPMYAAVAGEIVDQRLKTFERMILAKVAANHGADPEAFKDPDFQYLISSAQSAYARSGDLPSSEILVDLIAERSKERSRSRLSLSLNEAVVVSPRLTINEFAELSLCFILRYTLGGKIDTYDKLAEYLSSHVLPFIHDVSSADASYQYLEYLSCGRVDENKWGIDDTLMGVVRHNYGSFLAQGVKLEDIEHLFPDISWRPVIVEGLLRKNRSGLWYSTCGNAIQLEHLLGKHRIWNKLVRPREAVDFLLSKWPTAETMLSELSSRQPGINAAVEFWDNTHLRYLALSSVGIAIGWANAKRVCNFEGDLSEWIK